MSQKAAPSNTPSSKGPRPESVVSRRARALYSTQNPYAFYIVNGCVLWAFIFFFATFDSEMRLPMALYVSLNTATFLLTAFDKAIAPSQFTRVPEAVLWGAAAIGGSFGILFAMWCVRHKTSKPRFKLILAIVAILQMLLLSQVMKLHVDWLA